MVCVAATIPPIDITVVVIGDGLGSSSDSIVLINGIIILCIVYMNVNCCYIISLMCSVYVNVYYCYT